MLVKRYKFGITNGKNDCVDELIDEISHYGKIIYVEKESQIVYFFLETDEINFSAILDDYFFPEGSNPNMYEVRSH